uniref:Uncharacterized protein n=1 Tax=Siphoviridae sp. ctLqe90 TaxID=2825456 RepID=A0A8S5Q2Z2_9CAUD|nr:MAG TPA: hypothetical protein [Siphoviridae sp. ctLqe90]DAG36097.1 MAG TPA: hypothetical protein [Caudoviricetes sp.]
MLPYYFPILFKNSSNILSILLKSEYFISNRIILFSLQKSRFI